jgi:hypothetical protein
MVSDGQDVIAEAERLVEKEAVAGQLVDRAHLAGVLGPVSVGEIVSLVGAGGDGRVLFEGLDDELELEASANAVQIVRNAKTLRTPSQTRLNSTW